MARALSMQSVERMRREQAEVECSLLEADTVAMDKDLQRTRAELAVEQS